MKRIILSMGVIVFAIALIAGGTTAFFFDEEVSANNTFVAGAIDLKIDNESYYNGAVSSSTTWLNPEDLDEGRLFLNFTDLKPDDEGEDTISLHVDTNDAWACMDMTLTSNDDISSNEPELDTPDDPEDVNDTWDGELAQNVEMFWWADDGDNVYELGEEGFLDDATSIFDMFGSSTTSSTFSVALADAQNNVWGEDGPIPGEETRYVGKAWCFGDMTLDPVEQDNATTSGPLDGRGTGFLCDGTELDNLTQTDGLTMDIGFRAIQARHNDEFLCGEGGRTATITVVKEVINNNGGNNVVADFQLFVDNGVVTTNVTSGTSTTVLVGNYTVGEIGVSGYEATFGGDCDASGQVVLEPGDNKTCTITNDDLPANITLVKNVINNNGGTAGPTLFGLRIDGVLVPHNSSRAVTSNSPHSINEDGRAGYTFVSITGNPKCPAVLGGTATLDEGEAITCTITNDDNPVI